MTHIDVSAFQEFIFGMFSLQTGGKSNVIHWKTDTFVFVSSATYTHCLHFHKAPEGDLKSYK